MPAPDQQQAQDPAGSPSLPPARVEHERELEPAGAPRPPHDARRRLFSGALIAVVVAVPLLLVGFLLGEREGRRAPGGPAWSQWRPTQDGAAGARQIAARVGREYRLPGGQRLVRVEGGELEVAGLRLKVAIRQGGGDIQVLDDEGVLYRLCGLGENCAITVGEPSPERHLLLRREALELALYSLRYLDGAEQVVVLLPPTPGEEPSQALLFRRDQMQDALAKPLAVTLVDRAPTVARVLRSPDTLLVDQLTMPTLFRFVLTPTSRDGRALLVLEPLNSRGPEGGGRTRDPHGSNAALGS